MQKAEAARQRFELTAAEQGALRRLPPYQGFALRFWDTVCAARGLDRSSVAMVMGSEKHFSALPLQHDRHWCWPQPLNVKRTPDEIFAQLSRDEAKRLEHDVAGTQH